jgi:hypothetical protein
MTMSDAKPHTIRICDACLRLEGDMCHEPSCVFCRRTMAEVGEYLDTLLIRPVIDGERLPLPAPSAAPARPEHTHPGEVYVPTCPACRAECAALNAAGRMIAAAPARETRVPCGGRACWRTPDGGWVHAVLSGDSCSVRRDGMPTPVPSAARETRAIDLTHRWVPTSDPFTPKCSACGVLDGDPLADKPCPAPPSSAGTETGGGR